MPGAFGDVLPNAEFSDRVFVNGEFLFGKQPFRDLPIGPIERAHFFNLDFPIYKAAFVEWFVWF